MFGCLFKNTSQQSLIALTQFSSFIPLYGIVFTIPPFLHIMFMKYLCFCLKGVYSKS